MYLINQNNQIIREADGASIPADKNNRDYQEYLVWVAAGNTAEQVDNTELTTAQQRAIALAALDPLICQIQRYTLLGKDASVAQAKLKAAMADIDERYPEN